MRLRGFEDCVDILLVISARCYSLIWITDKSYFMVYLRKYEQCERRVGPSRRHRSWCERSLCLTDKNVDGHSYGSEANESHALRVSRRFFICERFEELLRIWGPRSSGRVRHSAGGTASVCRGRYGALRAVYRQSQFISRAAIHRSMFFTLVARDL